MLTRITHRVGQQRTRLKQSSPKLGQLSSKVMLKSQKTVGSSRLKRPNRRTNRLSRHMKSTGGLPLPKLRVNVCSWLWFYSSDLQVCIESKRSGEWLCFVASGEFRNKIWQRSAFYHGLINMYYVYRMYLWIRNLCRVHSMKWNSIFILYICLEICCSSREIPNLCDLLQISQG